MSRKHIKDKRRQELIEANMACIAKHGLTDTTIAHVAKAASMSRGIVNFYFETKERMMQETLAALIEEYHQTIDEALSHSGDKQEWFVQAHFELPLCSARRLAVWAAFVAHAASHSNYRQMIAESKEKTLGYFKDFAIADDRAEALLGLLEGLWLQFLLEPLVVKRDQLGERCRLLWKQQPAAPAKQPAATVAKQQPAAVVIQPPAPVIQPQIKPVEEAVAAKKPVKLVPKPKEEAPQLDFGDLFAKKA